VKTESNSFTYAVAAQRQQLFEQFGSVMTRSDIALVMRISQSALSVMASRHGGAKHFFPSRLPGGRARYATAIVAAWICGELAATPLHASSAEPERSRTVGRPRKGAKVGVDA